MLKALKKMWKDRRPKLDVRWPKMDATDGFVENPAFSATALIAQMEQAQRERNEHLRRMEYGQAEFYSKSEREIEHQYAKIQNEIENMEFHRTARSFTLKAGSPLKIGDLVWDESGKAMGIVTPGTTGDVVTKIEAGKPYEAVFTHKGVEIVNASHAGVPIMLLDFPYTTQVHKDYDAARKSTKVTLIVPGYIPLVFNIPDELFNSKHEFIFKDGKIKSVEYFQDERMLGNAVLLPINSTVPVVRMKDMVDDRKSFRKKKVEKEDGVLFNRSIRKHLKLDTFPRLKRFLSPELKRIVSQTA